MKKGIIACVFILCTGFSYADDAAQKFANLSKEIQSVQNSIPPMLSNLEDSLQAQIKGVRTEMQKNIDSIQSQIQQLQTDTDAKLAEINKSIASS